MFEVMEAHPEVFNDFAGDDAAMRWTTSFVYNFVIWVAAAGLFHRARPGLRGGDLLGSLQVYGLAFTLFAATNAVLMNHYDHPREFYVASIVDGALAFAVVAVVNGLCYRRVMGPSANDG